MQFLQHPTLLEIKEWLNYQETAQEEEARVLSKDKKYTQEELFQQKVEFLKDYRKKFTEQQLAELVQDLKDKSSIFIAEKFEASLLRLFQILTRLFDTASKVYFSLKFDIHSKCMAYLLRTPEKITSQETASDFSSNNYSDFFQDLQRVDNVVQEQAPQQLIRWLYDDLIFMIKHSIQQNILTLRFAQINFLRLLLKEITTVQSELKKIPYLAENEKILTQKFNYIKKILSLNLIEEKDLLDHVSSNTLKYKFKNIMQYFQLRQTYNQQVLNERDELIKKIKKYVL